MTYSAEFRLIFHNMLQATVFDLKRSINTHALLRHNLTAEQLTPQLESSRAMRYLGDYRDGLKLGEGLPSTELQPADDLAILTAQVFVNIWSSTEDEMHLYNAASLLEFGLTKSKHSFQMRLLLVRIYILLGASRHKCTSYVSNLTR